MPDSREVPQFDATGKKFEWRDLPSIPTKVKLVPFSKALEGKVRSNAKIPAMSIDAKPTELENFGEGIMAGQDQRTYFTPLVKCLICNHTWPFNPKGKAECPACHSRDEWFCAECQGNKEPLIVNDKALCPECKARGKTRGLKRIMKFQITQSILYETQYWIRSPPVEMRITDAGTSARPWRKSLPSLDNKTEN